MNDGVKGRGPREKMAERGIGALDDTELLALLLGSGAARRPVIELAGSLLLRFGGLRGLLRARRESLERQPGLGPAKTGQLLAVLELSRRYLDETLARGKPLESPDMTERYLKTALRDHPHGANWNRTTKIGKRARFRFQSRYKGTRLSRDIAQVRASVRPIAGR